MKQPQNIIVRILRIIFVVILAMLVAVNIYIAQGNLEAMGKSNLVILISLIIIITFQSKFTWWAGVILALYGLYYFWFITMKVAEPGAIEFTNLANDLIFGGKTGSKLRHFISLFPYFFYLVLLVFLFMRSTRKEYRVTMSWVD